MLILNHFRPGACPRSRLILYIAAEAGKIPSRDSRWISVTDFKCISARPPASNRGTSQLGMRTTTRDSWCLCKGEEYVGADLRMPTNMVCVSREKEREIGLHLKLRNINFHNVTHSPIFQNPKEWMFVVQISLFIVTLLSLISWNLSWMQTTKEVNPHPRIASCVNMWSVTFLFLFFFLCHLLNVGACVHHIVREGQVEWITLASGLSIVSWRRLIPA